MKFNCYYLADKRKERNFIKTGKLSEWHLHFLWCPTKTIERDCRWLENVERRFVYFKWDDRRTFPPEHREYRACR